MIYNNIDSESYYSVREIYENTFFSWIGSYQTLVRWIKRDLENGNVEFKAIVTGNKSGKRYLVKGETIIQILQKEKDGKLIQNYESKTNS